MLQFQGEQYNIEELIYIQSALMMIQVKGEQARQLVYLQDKTQKLIEMANAQVEPTPTSTPPGKRK